jgi:hypothetical protein
MEEVNGVNKLRERVATLEEQNRTNCQQHLEICKDLDKIWVQISNHIPTSIENLHKELDEFRDKAKTQFIVMLTSAIFILIGLVIDITLRK